MQIYRRLGSILLLTFLSIFGTLFSRCLESASAADNSSQKISMQVEDISQRFDKPRNSNEVVLTLSFHNPTKNAVSLPLFLSAGKGANENSPRQFKLMDAKHHDIYNGGSYAAISYKWTSAHESPLEGTCETGTPVDIAAGKTEELYLPVKAPTKNGKYILTVLFDNRHLLLATKTFNAKQNYDNCQFISLKSEQMIELGP